jgi:hypothetical protein
MGATGLLEELMAVLAEMEGDLYLAAEAPVCLLVALHLA